MLEDFTVQEYDFTCVPFDKEIDSSLHKDVKFHQTS